MSSNDRKPRARGGVLAGSEGLARLRAQAEALYRAGRLVELEGVCREILRQTPHDAGILYLLGLSLQGKEGDAAAVDVFLEAAARDGRNAVLVLAAANALSSVGRYPEAIEFFRRFLELQPTSDAACNQIGLLYHVALGRVRDGIGFYRKALSIKPDNVEALNNLGNALQDLGKKRSAAALYRKAISMKPDFVQAHYNLHAVLLDDGDPTAAIGVLRDTLRVAPSYPEAKARLAMLLDLGGQEREAGRLFAEVETEAGHLSYLIDSWSYVKSHRGPGTRIFAVTLDALRHAFSKAGNPGLILEFGVRYGTTLNFIARQTREPVHGFDSFEGIPEAWKGEERGRYSTYGELPPVCSNVILHKGWFEETLPVFCATHEGPVRFMNIDCDIYSSTKTVFDCLQDRIVSGTVIVFDEYLGNPNWREDEFKAFQEFVAGKGLEYEYLLFSPFSKQAAVRVK